MPKIFSSNICITRKASLKLCIRRRGNSERQASLQIHHFYMRMEFVFRWKFASSKSFRARVYNSLSCFFSFSLLLFSLLSFVELVYVISPVYLSSNRHAGKKTNSGEKNTPPARLSITKNSIKIRWKRSSTTRLIQLKWNYIFQCNFNLRFTTKVIKQLCKPSGFRGIPLSLSQHRHHR